MKIKPRTPEERLATHGSKVIRFPWQKFGADFHSALGSVYWTGLYDTIRAAARDARRSLQTGDNHYVEVFDRRTGKTVWTSR